MAATGINTLSTALLVRRIVPEDAAQAAELSAQLGYPTSVAQVEERIRALALCREGQVAFVACLGVEVVGWAEAAVMHHLQSAPHTLITGLVVKDGMRGRGVGKKLCAEVEAWSRTNGVTILRVTSRTTRERAHKFYLREGFRQTKVSAVFEKLIFQQE